MFQTSARLITPHGWSKFSCNILRFTPRLFCARCRRHVHTSSPFFVAKIKPKPPYLKNAIYRREVFKAENLVDPSSTPTIPVPIMANYNHWHPIFLHLSQEKDRFVPTEEWQQTFDHCYKDNAKIARSFYGAMMALANAHRYFQFGHSLIAHFRRKNIIVNSAVAGKYIKLCGKMPDGEEREEKMMDVYGDLLKLSPKEIFDAGTCEDLIQGFYLTKQWRKCLKFVQCIEITGSAGNSVLSFMLAACYLNNEPDLASTYLAKLRSDQRAVSSQPLPLAFQVWFDYARKSGWSGLMDMLEYIREASWFIPFEVAKSLKEYVEKEIPQKWTAKFTTVTIKGECRACQDYLAPISLKKEEFESLRSTFLNLVSKKNDVFIHTNPAELEAYKSFIEKNAPFDVVVDGLNVAYFQNSNRATNRTLAHRLRVVTEHLLHRHDKKILILGRKHMVNWPTDEMTRIRQLATMFLVDNQSEDDHFLLYAAIYSGLQCVLLSGDLYRDYRFKVESSKEDLRYTFLKWQRTHQLELLAVHNNDQVKIKAPMKFDTVVQMTPNSIHIPYDSGIPRSLHELPTTWLCLTNNRTKDTTS